MSLLPTRGRERTLMERAWEEGMQRALPMMGADLPLPH